MSLGLAGVDKHGRIVAAIESLATPTPGTCGPILTAKRVQIEQSPKLVLLWSNYTPTWEYVIGQYRGDGRTFDDAAKELVRILQNVRADCRGIAYAMLLGFRNSTPSFQRMNLNGNTFAVDPGLANELTSVEAIGDARDAVSRVATLMTNGDELLAAMKTVLTDFCTTDPSTYSPPIVEDMIESV